MLLFKSLSPLIILAAIYHTCRRYVNTNFNTVNNVFSTYSSILRFCSNDSLIQPRMAALFPGSPYNQGWSGSRVYIVGTVIIGDACGLVLAEMHPAQPVNGLGVRLAQRLIQQSRKFPGLCDF